MTRTGLAILVTVVVSASIVSAQGSPRIRLLYTTILDRECANLTKTDIDGAWVQEGIRRTPEFQALWDTNGRIYLEAALSEAGLPFPYLEMQVYLTVCPVINGMSAPLLVNLRPFLQSTLALPGKRWPMWFLAELIFHELLHHYVSPVQEKSVLRQKYSSETVVTRNHLHVMALEKTVFLKIGLSDELKFIGEDYRTNAGPAYKRAWEIVNEIEGERPFLKEIQALASAK